MGQTERPLCIDGRMLSGSPSGVANYARNLVTAVRGVGLSPALLCDGGYRRSALGKAFAAARWGKRRLEPSGSDWIAPDIFREAQVHFSFYRRALPLTIDGPSGLMHWTYPVPLYIRGWRNLYTVHDAIPLLRPALTPINRGRHERLMKAILPHAYALIAVSQAGRQDLVRAHSLPLDQVITCEQGVDVTQTPGCSLPATTPPAPYLLSIGSVEPRKNIERLIAAHQESRTSLPLLIVGSAGWQSAPILAAAAAANNVHYLPAQPRPVLLRLLAGAHALLFPSLAEGFGLPVAEAITLGIPTLASRLDALEEVAGGAALIVDPLDTSAIAQAILRITTDTALRKRLVDASHIRKDFFSMSAYGQRLHSLYQSLSS